MSERSKPIGQAWYFYFARCKDHSLYAGITNDLARREQLHNSGAGAKYTRARRPVQIVYSESYPSKSEARKREIQIKGWRRMKKESLILRAREDD